MNVGMKGVVTRHRRAAAKNTAAPKSGRAAGRKAATTKKRTAAGKNAADTSRSRAAESNASARRGSKSRDDIDRLILRATSRPLGYDFQAKCTSLRVVRRYEGGVVYSGLRLDRPVLVQDDGTLADLAPEIADKCVTIVEFRTIGDRDKYLRLSRPSVSRRRTV